MGPERHSLFTPSKLPWCLAVWCPARGPALNIRQDAQPRGLMFILNHTISKVLAHLMSSESPSSLEGENECKLSVTEEEIASREVIRT